MRVRTCLVVVCLLSGVSVASAQQRSEVQAGLVGGLTLFRPTLRADAGNIDFDANPGWAGGVFITTAPNGLVSLQHELHFAVKRAEFAQPGNVLIQQRFTSIDVPIFVRFSTRQSRSTGLHVLAGPAFTFRTGVRQTTSAGGTVTTQDIGNQVRTFDLAIAVGGGLDVGRWLFDVRYTHGLRNVIVDQSGNARVRLHTTTVMTGIRF
jgi:hypothetical protein